MLIFVISATTYHSQNVIKVKKKVEEKTFSPKGIYYSDAFTLSTGQPGEPPIDYKRMYLYIDEYNQIYIFHSNKKASKVISKFMKEPKKWTEETGKIEFSEGAVYMKSQDQHQYNVSYRYYGELTTESSIYLAYKATAASKVTLQIHLYKYTK